MKKALLVLLVTFFATMSFAQQQLATLNHNDSISVFYGATALQQAHAAAVNGDIITLSPGSFNSLKITKAVTIRGAGMFPDTVAGTAATILLDNFTFEINEDPLHSLCMEGIYCSGYYIYYSKVYNPQFIKCFFRTIYPSSTSSNSTNSMNSATFVNCVINQFASGAGNSSTTYAHNSQFINSVILDCSFQGNISLQNCVAKLDPNHVNGVSVNNSIVYYSSSSNTYGNAYTSFNSIGINTYSNNYLYFGFQGIPNHYLYNYYSLASVFKNFRGTYGDGITFELLDTVAATCLGSDGTQVGIYGGMMPFDPSVRNPLIKKCNVASRSTADGKLAVDIEIVSE